MNEKEEYIMEKLPKVRVEYICNCCACQVVPKEEKYFEYPDVVNDPGGAYLYRQMLNEEAYR